MSDTIKQIREAIESKIISLPDGFTKLDNKFNLEKNNFTNESKKFGVIAKDGSPGIEMLRALTFSRDFEITYCNKFIPQINKDEKQEEIGDILESIMEDTLLDLSFSKAGLPLLVTKIVYNSNAGVEYEEIENLAILRFIVSVDYRKTLINC